jgi:hypothetical protein
MDHCTMKNLQQCISDIGRGELTIFSTLDLTSRFWRMPLQEESVTKTAFILPKWLNYPMGLLGWLASFQRLIKK